MPVRNPRSDGLRKLKGLYFLLWLSVSFFAIGGHCGNVNPPPVLPKIYKTEVVFDPLTAHPSLVVSEDKKYVKSAGIAQDIPDNPERFNSTPCLLGFPEFTSGKHYWEVVFGKQREWAVGVAKASVERKVYHRLEPKEGIVQEGVWWLRRMESNSHTLPDKPEVIGVFLNCEKGTVAFYMGNKVIQKTAFPCKEVIRPFFYVGGTVELRLK